MKTESITLDFQVTLALDDSGVVTAFALGRRIAILINGQEFTSLVDPLGFDPDDLASQMEEFAELRCEPKTETSPGPGCPVGVAIDPNDPTAIQLLVDSAAFDLGGHAENCERWFLKYIHQECRDLIGRPLTQRLCYELNQNIRHRWGMLIDEGINVYFCQATGKARFWK